jgi:hypothetical protein
VKSRSLRLDEHDAKMCRQVLRKGTLVGEPTSWEIGRWNIKSEAGSGPCLVVFLKLVVLNLRVLLPECQPKLTELSTLNDSIAIFG